MDGSQAKVGVDAAGSTVDSASADVATSYVVHLLLPCDKGDHALAEIAPQGCFKDPRLPTVRIVTHDEEYFTSKVLERKVEEACPYPVCLVRRLYCYKEEDVDNPGCKVINDLWIAHPAGDLPSMTKPLAWVHKDDAILCGCANAIQLLVEGHVHGDIVNLFDAIQSGADAHAKPWEVLGFYKRLTSWSFEALRDKSMVMKGRIRLMRDGEDGRIFTCDAQLQDNGDTDNRNDKSEVIFIKSTFPLAREVQRALAVASVFGNIVPEIIGFDLEWGTLMQRDAGKLMDEPYDQEAIIGTILYMQRVSVNHISELEAKGLRVMDTEWLEPRVESILNHIIFDEYFKSEEDIHECCDEEREVLKSLRSKSNEIRRRVRRITKLWLPRTIVHGDCYVHNMGRSTTTEEGKLYRIFDWAKAFIGNPLVDLESILFLQPKYAGGKLNREAAVRQICKEWKQLAGLTREELRKVLRDMCYLSCMFDLYELEEQLDSHMGTATTKQDECDDHKDRIVTSFRVLTKDLDYLNEHIERTGQGSH